MVADGMEIQTKQAVKEFTWEVQGHWFTADVYVIPLKGCEMVLGVKWLAQLGNVTWNVQSLSMKFMWKSAMINLQGGGGKETGKTLELNYITKVQKDLSSQLIVVCWVLLMDGEHNTNAQGEGKENGGAHKEPTIAAVLEAFGDVSPAPLLPHKLCDHSIILKEGLHGVCIRPYIHSANQKDVIE